MTSPPAFLREATAAFGVQDFETCRTLALQGLQAQPADLDLLRLAGLSSLELGRDDAVLHLSALVARTPQDPGALLHLGHAHAARGHADEAADVFAKVLQITPDDVGVALEFAYAAHAAGRTQEAVSVLERASNLDGVTAPLLRSLASLAEAVGQLPLALGAASRVAVNDPKDVDTALNVAELNLALGHYVSAATAFARLRSMDLEDGHETYACHGQVEALIRAERWRDALDAAIAATSVDRHSLTTDLLAFVSVALFGPGEQRVAPQWPELETRLQAQRAMHRRLHAERWAS